MGRFRRKQKQEVLCLSSEKLLSFVVELQFVQNWKTLSFQEEESFSYLGDS